MADRFRDPAAEVGRGLLPQTSAVVYRVFVLQVSFLAAASPAVLLGLLLEAGAGNALLQGVALIPVAPALSALLYGWRHSTFEDDLRPARYYWAGYRRNLADVLRWWLPVVAVLMVLMINAGGLSTVATGGRLVLLSVSTLAVVALVLLVSAHALVITSLFSVRARDLPRLMPRCLAMPGPTIGALALIVCGLGLAALVSDWLVILLAAPAMIALHHLARPLIIDIEENFAS